MASDQQVSGVSLFQLLPVVEQGVVGVPIVAGKLQSFDSTIREKKDEQRRHGGRVTCIRYRPRTIHCTTSRKNGDMFHLAADDLVFISSRTCQPFSSISAANKSQLFTVRPFESKC